MSAEGADRIFFDTNILLYRISANDPRQARARALTEAGGRISVQSLNEFVNVARRKLRLEWDVIDRQLRAIYLLCNPILPVTFEVHTQAIAIARLYGFSTYDANALACAQLARCGIFYSEDLQDGQRIGGLIIRNPFKTPA